jgi:uncharacterized protein (TIGR03790 family)
MLATLVVLSFVTGSCSAAERNSVLVITNSESPISMAIGNYYAAARKIPRENIVQLKIPLRDAKLGDRADETITDTNYQRLIRRPLEEWIEERGLRDSLEILVTTKGIPLRVSGNKPVMTDWLRTASVASVDAELSLLFSDSAGSAGIVDSINPFFDARLPFREFREQNPGTSLQYMVARLTGYGNDLDVASGLPRDIKNLIDAATREGDENEVGTWLVDEDPSRGKGLWIANQLWLQLTSEILSAMGLKVQHDRSRMFVSDAGSIAGYTSWGSNDGKDPGQPYY